MTSTVRLTVSQALVRYLAALRAEVVQPDGSTSIQPYCGGVFAIFGHGNVAGLARPCMPKGTGCPPFAPTANRAWPMRPWPLPRPISASA